ncbi:MAG: hypothetical protein AAGE01_15105 [Pseudomonadota bacterium]
MDSAASSGSPAAEVMLSSAVAPAWSAAFAISAAGAAAASGALEDDAFAAALEDDSASELHPTESTAAIASAREICLFFITTSLKKSTVFSFRLCAHHVAARKLRIRVSTQPSVTFSLRY